VGIRPPRLHIFRGTRLGQTRVHAISAQWPLHGVLSAFLSHPKAKHKGLLNGRYVPIWRRRLAGFLFTRVSVPERGLIGDYPVAVVGARGADHAGPDAAVGAGGRGRLQGGDAVVWRNTVRGYGLIQIALHWTTAGLVALLIPLGLWMTGLDYYDPWYKRGPDLHRAIGVLLGILLLARVASRVLQVRPCDRARSAWERRLATTTHLLLYALPFLLVISGYLVSTADGRAVEVFGWFEVPATLYGFDGQEDRAGEVHFALAMLLLAIVAVHAGGALRHHFAYKDDTLRRMLRPPIATETVDGP
jgi:cytochrome b561